MADNKAMFYLGKLYDQAARKGLEEILYYDPTDLTTHAVITGMTGSGKTGLGIGLLEEAALQGYPAIIVDPKGDLTNLALHFPNLSQQDFEPWMDAEGARREGKSVADKAAETAAMWKKGLADWGLGAEQITALSSAVDYAIYTPGSTAGIPINIMASFEVPNMPWKENSEALRDFISSTISGLLNLIGLADIDPLRSREHILLSNLMEYSWSQGKSLTLTDLIMQVQNPPMERLGAFPLDSFFPVKDRTELAMLLNNFLASPSFNTWMEGQSLDVGQLLYTPEGKPRHSIFYLAHLDDSTRMFFVTLLFASIETWMRSQRGTSGLRALVYFDEVLGYLPPVQNPPSRGVLLRLLKQARAFGIGLVLATQNPVDLDYKALSNMGTWMIGRLQTERDKMRLLDGLQNTGGTLDIGEVDKMISGLGKRVFLMHNVHESKPAVFQTRWAMNYLAGPLTPNQIPSLNRLLNADIAREAATPSPKDSTVDMKTGTAQPAPAGKSSGVVTSKYYKTKPAVPPGIDEYFLSNEIGIAKAISNNQMDIDGSPEAEGIIYQPALLSQAQVRYISNRYGVDYVKRVTALVDDFAGGMVDWPAYSWKNILPEKIDRQPIPNQGYAVLPGWLSNDRQLKSMQNDFIDWIYRTGTVQIKADEDLKVYYKLNESEEDFQKRYRKALDDAIMAEQKPIIKKYEDKIKAIQRKVDRQEMEVDEAQDELGKRKLEELGAGGELLFSLLSRRKKSISSSMTKRRLTSQAKGNLEQEKQEKEMLEKDLSALDKEYKDSLQELKDKWADAANRITEIPLSPLKKDIFLELNGVLWLPYYLVKTPSGELREIAAFEK